MFSAELTNIIKRSFLKFNNSLCSHCLSDLKFITKEDKSCLDLQHKH